MSTDSPTRTTAPTKRVKQTSAPVLQRACACGRHTQGAGECAECKQKRTGALQRVATSSGPDIAPPIVHNVLRSSGRPLDAATRAFMEPRFGHDFSGVRVHTNDRAAESARAVSALAYTVGNNVVFGAGQYAPETSSGQRLLAHELTHVVQQGGQQPATRLPIENVNSPHEQAARAAADGHTTTNLASHSAGLMREPVGNAPGPADQSAEANPPAPADKAAETKAATLETEILAEGAYKKLNTESKGRVQWIIAQARTKPLGDAPGQRNYYLTKLKIAISTPFEGKESGATEYGCSDTAEKQNREAVDKALDIEKKWWEGSGFENVEEDIVATGTNKVKRKGEQGKTFLVDRSDPRNIRVQMKVKLKGKPEEVAKIKKLEDAIERASHTKGYYLDIVFVDTSGPDVFEFSVMFCQWANSGNWASGPTTLSHEVHHALGLGDRYDYIESHSANRQMNVPMRLVWFAEQMKKTTGPRDKYSKMARNTNPLLAEDVCTVAFAAGADRKKCIDTRKDLDPAGIPPP